MEKVKRQPIYSYDCVMDKAPYIVQVDVYPPSWRFRESDFDHMYILDPGACGKRGEFKLGISSEFDLYALDDGKGAL